MKLLIKSVSAGVCLGCCLLTNNASAQYFDVNGATSGYGIVNGATYSWDAANWGISGGAGATANWTPGGFARFYGGVSGNAYSVTVNNSESMAGLYQHTAGVAVTINGAGSGDLNVTSGDQGFLVTSGGSMFINAPITGLGAVAPELGGSLYLYGNNTYAGGTAFGYSGAPLVYFNNSSSFGTGSIRLSVNGTALFQALLATGGSTITLANDFQNKASGSGVNFAGNANTPVSLTGNWDLGANAINIRNSAGSTSPLTLSGVISGTADVTFSANNSGNVIHVNGVNSYNGKTRITDSGGIGGGSGAVTVQLGTANAISSTTGVIMDGGTLNPGGFDQAITAAPLTLVRDSMIDFGAGASELDFANSSLVSWVGTLNLANWDPLVDKLRFGSDDSGLTLAQLNSISFNGDPAGGAVLDSDGYVGVAPVPEPSTIALGMMGGVAFLGTAMRRRFKK